jgi:hypothetical protein
MHFESTIICIRTEYKFIERSELNTYKMKKTKLILSHFYSPDDLLHGIEVLQHHHIPILEVHLSKPINDIENKLRIKNLRLGHLVIKLGLLGGTAIPTLVYYIIEKSGLLKVDDKSVFTIIFTLLVMVATFLFATFLFPGHAPRVIHLPASESIFLILVDAKGIIPHKDIQNLFQYAEAVEISTTIKNIVTA